MPRQSDGQDLVERAVDGLAGGAAVLRIVERGQCVAPAGQADAGVGGDGSQRRSIVYAAGDQRADQGEQDVLDAGGAGSRSWDARSVGAVYRAEPRRLLRKEFAR